MDLVALESEHEKKYFMKSCENNYDLFEEYLHIGGVSENDGWNWISSNKKISFDLSLKEPENRETSPEANCLQLLKSKQHFTFGRVQCSGSKLQQFVCQKLIVKENSWTDLFSR